MNPLQKHFSPWVVVAATFLGAISPAWAQAPKSPLGTASAFAILAGTNATCTGGSVVIGDIGVAPGSAVPFTNTGCIITGATPPATDAAAVKARVDFLSAYAAFQAQSTTCTAVSGNLSGVVLAPSVYCLDAVAKAGTLTLAGPSNGVWIFLIDGALTATDFTVVMADGGDPCNVYWVPTAAATLTTTAFKGNILAGNPIGGSITLTGGTLAGSALANVAVTMTGTSIIGCETLSGPLCCHCKKHHKQDKDHSRCNQGVGNGPEGCDPGQSNQGDPGHSNDELGGTPGNPGRKGDRK